jgi:hypothetical protein
MIRYDTSFKVRCEPALADAIKAAAAACSMKPSAWLREAVFLSLQIALVAEAQDSK